MINQEVVPCNICETSNFEEKLYSIRSGTLVKCSQCGLYYASPRDASIIQAVLTNNTRTELCEAKKLNYKGRVMEFKTYVHMINRLKPAKGKLLDIGCYEGNFLEQAKAGGWECYGVEPEIGAARYANEQLHLNVKQCVIEKAEFEDNCFDAITILATLEHVPDPRNLLVEVKRILKPDGVLLVSVPTIPAYLPIIRSKWRMFIGDHYYFFTDESLQKLLEKVGFKLEKSEFVTKNVDLDTISARLAEDWQPNNLGKFGGLLRKIILFMKIEKIRFNVNLFDTKIYTITSS